MEVGSFLPLKHLPEDEMKIFIFLYRIQKESRSVCREVRQGQVFLPLGLCISENSLKESIQVSYTAGL